MALTLCTHIFSILMGSLSGDSIMMLCSRGRPRVAETLTGAAKRGRQGLEMGCSGWALQAGQPRTGHTMCFKEASRQQEGGTECVCGVGGSVAT